MGATRRTVLFGGAASLIARKLSAQIIQTRRIATGGFTQVMATADGGGPVPGGVVPLLQQGIRYSGKGSRVLYVSSSAGNDRNIGTKAAPFATKAAALSHMRNGYPDQMLCKCGDVWPASDAITIRLSGAGPGIIGQQCTGPLLFGFYGTGNRPVHQISEDSPNPSVMWIAGDPGTSRNNIAIIGWEFYPPTCDPLAATYNTIGPNSELSPINLVQVGPFTSWLLIEDCRFSYIGLNIGSPSYALTTNNSTPSGRNVLYFETVPSQIVSGATLFFLIGSYFPQGTIVTGTTSTTVTVSQNATTTVPSGTNIQFLVLNGTVCVRRCLYYGAYNFGGGNNFAGHVSPFTFAGTNHPILDECAIAYGGWNPTLSAAQTVTASGGILTWPIGNYAFNALPFPNNATIYVQNPSGGSGLSANVGYNVVNANGNGPGTFQLSASKGGSLIAVANGTYTMMWADPSLNMFNHTLYLDDTCTTKNPQVTSNVFLFSTNVMVRAGGTITGNYVACHSAFGLYVGVQNNETGPGFVAPIVTYLDISGNVIQHPGWTIYANQFSTNPDGSGDSSGIAIDLENVNGSGGTANVTENIFSMEITSSLTTGGSINFCNDGQKDVVRNVSVNKNIFYKWNDDNMYNDLGYPGVFNNNSNTGAGLTVSPNAIDLGGNNKEGYPSPLRDLATYDSDMLGGPGTVDDAISQIVGTGPAVVGGVSRGLGRPLQTWPTDLTAAGIISYIQAGFGNPF